MKRLKGTRNGRLREDGGTFECDEIVLELDHGRTMTIRRESVSGEDGVVLLAGFERPDRTANARFVIRVPNFGSVNLSVEQAK